MGNALRVPFLEEEKNKIFVHRLRKLDIHKVLGVSHLPQEIQEEYARCKEGILLTVNLQKLNFQHLNVDDIEYYHLFRNMTIRPQNIVFALEAVKRFMRRHVNYTYCYDFQLVIETNQKRVNMTKPNLELEDLENYDLFTVIDQPELGVVYRNGENKKRFLRISEIAKFLDGTLKVVRLQLNHRLKENEKKVQTGEKGLGKFDRLALIRVLDALDDQLHFRRGIRIFESLLGIRQGSYSRWGR
ncbi:hypothetical protein L6452_15203 [Arctium lappa]|uniref:Uncharacterized protein n=1 Tax=Arctium lappa TaxID=4217 RepID=A0ACB9CNB5_ARCLA|nr:hypothetical protein L6452_15203 [Arctium lappa]